ncbi:PAS domain S-box-containing protein [Desulfacinum hydrothermale DSM 13146]|uniref:histidine kinase n=1 Tax=Desulfacinum hydrothermale DSM 13146 TaxID=1121390 RepID=A0A1W1XEJ0_9BACT|nr:PAS domain S-box protein [Desulfacinum hydrothermale]SMC22300.1 PAS domain S-box-containing protein [Desulfacinum hydrothermale DSM 13146]
MNQDAVRSIPGWLKITLALTLLLLVAAGAGLVRMVSKHQEKVVRQELVSIARAKAKEIAQWREEKAAAAHLLMGRHALIASIKRYLEDGDTTESGAIRRRLQPFAELSHCANILILDPEGQVRWALHRAPSAPHPEYERALKSALASRKPAWTSLHRGPENGPSHLSLVTPLFDPEGNGRFLAALALVMDASSYLYPLLQSWPVPSETAETLLVRRDGDHVLVLNDPRHGKDTALAVRIPLTRTELPEVMAVQGKEGIVEGKDDRGEDVVAAALSIPDSPWFLVAKIHRAEAFAMRHVLSATIVGHLLGVLLLLGVITLYLRQALLKRQFHRLYEAEKDLRTTMERHWITLQSIGDAVIATDARGRVELLNPVAASLTGWNREEALGKPIEEVFRIINEESRQPVESPVSRVLREGAVVGLANHTLLISKEGREIPIADSGAPIRDVRGEIRGVVLVFRDQSEERLRQRVTQTRLALVEYAAQHELHEVLARIVDEICALVESPIGFYHFVDPEQGMLIFQQWSTRTEEVCRVADRGTHLCLDRAGVWADGVRRGQPVIINDYASLSPKKELPQGHIPLVRLLAVPVMRQGRPVAVLGLGNKGKDYTEEDVKTASLLADLTWDIVSRKQAEEALRVSEERFRIAFQSSPDAININRLEDGLYVDINEGFTRATGYTREDVLGKTSLELDIWHDPEDRKRLVAALQRDSYCENMEALFRAKDGRILTGLMSARLIHIQGVPHIISITRDITRMKEAEEERRQLEAQLAQAQKMESVGHLAGGVAHDFNNLLNVILGHVELMGLQMPPDDPQHARLRQIEKAARRSADLTRQLLAFARRQPISPKVLDLNETVENMLKLLRRLIGENIDLIWRPDSHLWPVKMDPTQVDQIVVNLCVNASDAIGDHGRITLETENVEIASSEARKLQCEPGDYVKLAVSDTGCGMEKEILDRIFEPFFTTKEVGKGTGLGLSTIYGIVKQNQGSIEVTSEPGKGTRFEVYLPRHNGKTEDSEVEQDAEVPRGHGETVLLVEDEPSLLLLGQTMLETLGYQVLTAGTPQEALRHAREYPAKIHLLITDVVMPQKTGKDLCEAIQAIRPEIKVLFMSGYPSNVIAPQGVLEPGVHFIQKPFSLTTLGHRVRAVLSS